MCGAKNASAEMRSNVTFVSRMGSFVLDYHGLNVQPPFQHIEIPYRSLLESQGRGSRIGMENRGSRIGSKKLENKINK